MLLIQSNDFDLTTSMVIQWMLYYGIEFKRLNGEVNFLTCDFVLDEFGNISIQLRDSERNDYLLGEFTAYWYRRGDLYLGKPKLEKHVDQTLSLLIKEWEIIRDSIYTYLERLPRLGSIKDEKFHNKIDALLIASSVGITIPNTVVTGEKSTLKELVVENNSYITKAVWNMFNIVDGNRNRAVGTKRVSKDNVTKLQKVFSPTLLQEEVSKSYELRIFFIENKFYSMAIFSQNDPETELDFRHYNREKPNRNIPFKLPSELKLKLLEFIGKMGLTTGSIDMIVTPDNQFVFLEVNPIGQFGWLSKSCNYYLEEKIALHFKDLI